MAILFVILNFQIMDQEEILILGAGISGLVAGRILLRAGMSVTIIEARERVGGRILTIHRDGQVLEAGPEFIHGDLKETISLLKEFGIEYVEVEGKMYFARDSHFVEEKEYVEDWEQLMEKMRSLKTDLPFLQFLQENFGGESYRGLRKSAIGYAEGYDLADVSRVSTLSLIREWKIEEDGPQYRIPKGYSQLTDALAGEFIYYGGKILLNQQANHILWAPGSAMVTTMDNRKFAAKKLVVTLPLGVLTYKQDNVYTIQFSPDIMLKRKAMEQIGFGTVMKIVLQWKIPFWKLFVPDAQFIFSGKGIPTWWTQDPVNSNLLTGWVGGPGAEDFSRLPEEDLIATALESLSAVFGIEEKELKGKLLEVNIFNWKNEIFTRGAYSYSYPGSEQARATLKSPVEGTIYFAGEAYYDGPHGGEVEAAIISGMETARQIIRHAESG
jgi:monoamine oxidase